MEEKNEKIKKPRKHCRQKYRESWEHEPEFRRWLVPVEGDVHKAACVFCKKELVAEKTVIKLHASSSKHQRKEQEQGAKILEINHNSEDDDHFIEQLATETKLIHINRERVQDFRSTPLKKRKILINSPIRNLPEQNEPCFGLPPKDSFRQRVTVQPYGSNLSRQDEYSVYGEHVANNLRLSGRSRMEVVIAQHYIDQICFKLAMGTFAQKPYSNIVSVSSKNDNTTDDSVPSENATSKPSESPPQSTSAHLSTFCGDSEEPVIIVDS